MAFGSVVALAGAALVVVHLPPVEARLVAWALAKAQEAGVVVTVESASYNLFTLEGSARGLTIAAANSRETPFLVAEAAVVHVPLRTLVGPLRIDRLDVTRPSLTITRRSDGSLNLPAMGEPNGAGGAALPDIGLVEIHDARASYRDDAAGWRAEASGVELQLAGEAGTLSGPVAARSASIAAGDLEIRDATLAATVRTDGAATVLDQIRLEGAFQGGRISAGGRITSDPVVVDARLDWTDVGTARLTASRAPVTVAARVSGHADVDWAVAEGLRGLRLTLENRSQAGQPSDDAIAAAGRLTLTVAGGEWRLQHEHELADVVGASGDAHGRVDADDPLGSSVEGAVALNTADVPRALSMLARLGVDVPAWSTPSEGRLSVRLTLGGTLRSPTIAGDADLSGVEWAGIAPLSASSTFAVDLARQTVRGTLGLVVPPLAGQPVGRIDSRLSYADGRLRATDIVWRQQAGGRLAAALAFTPETGAYDVSIHVDQLDVQPITLNDRVWPVAALMSGEIAGRGTLDRPVATGRLTFSRLDWEGTPFAPVAVDLTVADGRARALAQAPDLATIIDASMALDEPHAFELTATATDADLPRLLSRVKGDWPPVVDQLTGSLSARITASGTTDALDDTAFEAELRQGSVALGPATVRLEQPAIVRLRNGRVAVDDLTVASGDTTIRVAGSLGPEASSGAIALTVDGRLDDARPWLALAEVPENFAIGGRIGGTLSASGSLERAVVRGRVQVRDGRAAWATYPEATGVSLDATVADGLIDVGSIAATWEGARVGGRLEMPLSMISNRLAPAGPAGAPVATFSGRIDDVTERTFARFLEPDGGESLTGRANARVDLSADAFTLDRLRGTIVLDEFAVDADGVPVSQVRPTRLEIEGTTVRVGDWSWEAEGNRFDVSGSAALGDAGALDLRASGSIDLRVIGAALPGVATAGVADVALRVTGTPASPLADGTADIRNGEARLADPQVAVSNVQGHVVLSGDRVELAAAQGTINGGPFTATGTLEHRNFRPAGGSLVVNATDVALNVPQGFRTQVQSGLTLTIAGDRTRVSGTVAIERGAYREPLSLAMSLLGAARQRAAEVAVGGTPAFAERVDLDVTLTSGEDLIVDNNYGRMDVSVDLRLIGTAARPGVVGRATIREGGVLYLGGRVYQVERGTIDFSNPRAIVPDLDLVARTRIAGVDVSLSIAGTPETVKGTLSSDPPLGQTDIVSLLVTGRLADQAGGAGTAVASNQVLAYLSGEAFGFAAQAIGLDTLRLEQGSGVDTLQSDPSLIAGDTDPSTRLTVSKRFSTYAEVILSRNLGESGQFTWVASFTPRRSVELRAVSLDDTSRLYEVRHDLSFGGPAAGNSGQRAAPSEPVASVAFTGAPGVPDRELRDRLDLVEGDRFDFYRWQNDRDRLRRFYLDRRFLEARVDARRAESGDGSTVALEYEIEPGPLAALDVEGVTLSSAALARLRDIWSNAIFDEALVTDLADGVRRELAAEGYLRARVSVGRPVQTAAPQAQEAGPVEKHVRVDVEPGDRSRSREVRFSGNDAVAAARLDALVTPDAWLQPATLADGVAALYRTDGYLAARVTAGPIAFDDDRAVLPVAIVEGPRFRVASVSIAGADARPEAEVRKAFGLEASAPFSETALDRARRALEGDYAVHGFNAAAVTTDTTIDRDAGTVAVALTIDEGPRQVLQSVAVTGAPGLDPGIITRMLELEAGEPVNLDAWYGARRRLFDLGLFRSVDIEPVPLDGAAHAPGLEPVEARVTLVRQPDWRLRYGFNISDEPAPAADARRFGAGASVDLQRRGLFGHPGTLGLTGRADRDDRIGRTYLTFPTFFGRRLKSSVFAERSRQVLEQEGFLSVVTNKTTVTAEQRFTAWRSLQLAYGYQFEWNHTFFDSDPNDPFGISFDETSQQARLTTTAIVDTRADPFDARRGLFHASEVEYGAAALGSDVRFLKYVLQQFVYVPVGPMVAASGVRMGLGAGFGQDLLPSERFFAGGVNTVRGYEDNALGSADFFGDPVGGQSMIVLNQELRFPIVGWLRGVGFIDAGNVFERARDLSFTDLAVGAGGGLRLSTPVGLLRLDLGVPLPRNHRSPRLYFSFGQIF